MECKRRIPQKETRETPFLYNGGSPGTLREKRKADTVHDSSRKVCWRLEGVIPPTVFRGHSQQCSGCPSLLGWGTESSTHCDMPLEIYIHSPQIYITQLTSNVCMRLGLIASFMSTVNAPLTPYNAHKGGKHQFKPSTTDLPIFNQNG